MPCASDALDEISKLAEGGGVQVLVTGSVLLVGDVGRLLALSHSSPVFALTFADFCSFFRSRFASFLLVLCRCSGSSGRATTGCRSIRSYRDAANKHPPRYIYVCS